MSLLVHSFFLACQWLLDGVLAGADFDVLPRAKSALSNRLATIQEEVLSKANIQHTTYCLGHRLWSSRTACTAIKGQGATVLSPFIASPEGVRVSVAFSSRRPSRPLCFQPAFSRCKTAAVRADLSSRPYVSSRTACPTVLPARRFDVATPKITSTVSR